MGLSKTTIALDAMGGDIGADVVVPASLKAIKDDKDLSLILVGDQEKLRASLAKWGGKEDENVMIHHASQVVEMDDLPSHA